MTPTAGVTYTITEITGTYNRDSVAYTITGLSSPFQRTFQWDGTPSSSLLSNGNGIQFNTLPGQIPSQTVRMYYGDFDYGPIDGTNTSFPGSDDAVVSSTLTPVPWETDALPVVGSTILFGLGVWAKHKFAKPLQK